MPFSIGTIQVKGDRILAPMDGYSSQPYRVFSRRLGSAASYSEFIGAIEVTQGYPKLEEKLGFVEEERPFAFQIFDNNPERILRAAELLRLRNPDFIDINLGCSAKQVSARGAGAGLLKDPEMITRILELLVRNLDIPITAKIRLGWDEHSLNYLEVSRRIEQAGCCALAVHARTKAQGYKGSADWNAIKEIKRNISIPVIGNGDVKTVADISRMLEQTSCDAVMIGRAALSNPWIFSGINRDELQEQKFLPDLISLIDLMQRYYNPARGIVLCRKFIARYLQPYSLDPILRHEVLTTTDREKLLEMISQIVRSNGSTPN
jgi:tRNA-dihydrouridine synthase B